MCRSKRESFCPPNPSRPGCELGACIQRISCLNPMLCLDYSVLLICKHLAWRSRKPLSLPVPGCYLPGTTVGSFLKTQREVQECCVCTSAFNHSFRWEMVWMKSKSEEIRAVKIRTKMQLGKCDMSVHWGKSFVSSCSSPTPISVSSLFFTGFAYFAHLEIESLFFSVGPYGNPG